MSDVISTDEDLMSEISKEAEAYCAERHELTLIVGVTQDGNRQVRSFRSPDAKHAPIPNDKSIYEIGSFSKIFTTSLLAVMESKGMISLDDTITKYLPSDVELKPEVAEITVRDLATHTAGFDRIGKVFAKMVFQDVRVCYLRYKKEDLYEELRVAELARSPRSGWEYSIIGMSLLGHILELAAGKPYEPLLKELVCEPLGLQDTTYHLTDEQESRVVRGYDEKGRPSPVWYWDVMLPQGGLRSTLHDMLTFAEANLRDDGSGLFADFRRARQQHYEWPEGYEIPTLNADLSGFTQGLGWWNQEGPNGTISCHAGATLSYQSFLGVNEKTNTGLVALTSSEKNLQDLTVYSKRVNQWLMKAIEVAE